MFPHSPVLGMSSNEWDDFISATSDEAVDVGLCFGWISGKRLALDDRYHLQRYVPRRPRSNWSELNKTKVRRLTAEHRMRSAGLDEVERAKADGRWNTAPASGRRQP